MSMGGGTSKTTTTQELSPEQRALIAPVIPIAKNYLAKPPTMYPGSGIAPFNPMQQQAQQMTVDAANGMMGTTGQTNNRYNQLYNNMNFLSSGDVLKPGSNPALQGAIDAASRSTIDNFQNNIMPQITAGGIDSGGFGGTRQGIGEGLAARSATQAVGDIASSMANTNYQAGLGAMVQGQGQQANLLGNQSNILQQQLLPAQLKESVGAQQGAMQQALLSEKVQKYVNQQMIPFSAAQDVAAMAFGMPGGTTNSTSTQPGNPMVGMQAAGGILSAIPALVGSSDRRLKENAVKIKTLVDGLVVYAYNYIGTVGRTIGLMADEVEALYPDAVGTDYRGFKYVKYLLVPGWMLQLAELKGAM